MRSFPTATLFTGISNWTSLRTNLLSEPLEYGYITTLYPTECNTYYNAYNSITLVNMIKDVDNYNFILKALDIKLVLPGNILFFQKAIMTFINDLSLYLNPTQMNNLWNSLLGTYGTHKAELSLSELDLYGSKRLGVIEDTISLNKFHFTGNYNPINNNYNITSFYSPTYTAIPNYNLTYWTYGKKKYELTNHLGNILSTVSDYKIPYINTSGKICYKPDVRSENRYYAFGGMKDSGYISNKLIYGFNGKPNDDGTGFQDYGKRLYDPEVCQFPNNDPIAKLYPQLSPKQFANNHPTSSIDIDGLEADNKFEGLERQDQKAAEMAHPNDATAQAMYIRQRQNVRGVGVIVGGAIAISLRTAPSISAAVYRSALIYASNPVAQAISVEVVSFTANMFYDGPDDPFPTSGPGGESGKMLMSFFKKFDMPAIMKKASVPSFKVIYEGTTSKIAVIGRNQEDRVIAFAKEIGAETFKPSSKAMRNETLILKENTKWINKLKKGGYSIIDIGLDPQYTKKGDFSKGKFYSMEIEKTYKKK